MTEPKNTEQPINQVDPPVSAAAGPLKKRWSPFRKALVYTSVPFIVASITWVVAGGFFVPLIQSPSALTVVLGFPLLAIPAAVIMSILLALTGRRQQASGVLAGLGMGIVAMGASCYASTFLFK